MLFKVHSLMATGEKDFFEENPGARAIVEFNSLTSKQMLCVCLIADIAHDSPFRSLPEKIRREQATKTAGYGMEDGKRPDKNARNIIAGKTESVEKAIIKYKEIQYDEDLAILEALERQIQETIAIMQMDKKEAAKIVKTSVDKKGVTTKTESIDVKMFTSLSLEASKLGARLPELREAKMKLLQTMQVSSPAENLMIFSHNDIDDSNDDSEEGTSTMDKYMDKKKKIRDDASN